MLHALSFAAPREASVLRGMFTARREVFVDLLGWDVPVVDGRYEIDQFDDAHASYIILTNTDGRHLGSARLLSTTRPHILGDLFPQLCTDAVPRGPRVREITRFCLDRHLRARERRIIRDTLVSALVDHALAHGIDRYTAVAELGWMQQVLSFGWRSRPLGLPLAVDGAALTALAIEIDQATPALLRSAGIHADPSLIDIRRAAA